MPRPLRVFLCHASQDKPAVWKLYRYLKQHGVNPWLDQEDLLPGEDWEVEIPKAIDASDVILVCLSKNSVNKEGMVQKEITFALDKALEKPEGTIFVVPVKLEECEMPRRLTRYQWVDLSRSDGRKRLLMGLNRRVNDLGPEVQQIPLDEARPRTATPKIPKPVVEEDASSPLELQIKRPEEQAVSPSATEGENEKPKKETPAKPFTKILKPESLAFNKIRDSQNEDDVNTPTLLLSPSKRRHKAGSNFTARFFVLGGIAIIVLILGGFGLNYLINNLPLVAASTLFPTKPPTSTTLSIGSTMTGEDGMTLLYVPAGEFMMGSNSGDSDEQPVHTVYLDAFWIDQTEVTNTLYALCVLADECDQPASRDSFTRKPYFGINEFDDYPVINVSWEDAKTYCLWVGRRLPTEAQWEKAARGTDGRTYPWGDESPNASMLNYNGSVGDTAEVGAYPDGASLYGAFDMAGNVWEWVADWYDSAYYQNSPSSNPLGPDSGLFRVLRGGSWYFDDINVRSADRYRDNPTTTNYIGFRCARSP
ncbi:MAG: SUMF1/EgtB/PvdO family nonheme iron enzyme [Chloroflexota bacterium]